jgi:hypothetical protein
MVEPESPFLILLSRWRQSLTLQKVVVSTLFFIGATWAVTRFCGLEVSPPGFFMDEATPSLDAMCLAETGKDHDDRPWPLFYTRSAGGGHHPLTLIGFSILWTKVFGTSRAAFRSVAAFWIVLTSVGLFLLARDIVRLVPKEQSEGPVEAAKSAFPWLVLLAALLSPWSFQFSRIAWEGPVAPAYMIFALVALVRSHRGGRAAIVYSLLAGVCAAASMCTYPPLRVAVPLVLVMATVVLMAISQDRQAKWRFARRTLLTGLAAMVLLAPTLRLLAKGGINERMNNVAIWNQTWVQEHIGPVGRRTFLAATFLDNILAHLRPSFLFVSGDASLRNSPQISGELSPVDLLALAFIGGGMLLALMALVRGRSQSAALGQPLTTMGRWLVGVAVCAMACALFGIAPAALTWERIPNALRAIGAWPFFALLTGAVLSLAWNRRRWIPSLITLVALAHTVHYLPAYFHVYDREETHWFMRDMPDAIAAGYRARPSSSARRTIANNLGLMYSYDEVGRYYLMSEAKMTCDEATSALRAYWKRANGEK